MFGAGAEERLTSPWHFNFKKRIWWLQVNLGTAFLAAAVVGLFESTIALFPILAAYQTDRQRDGRQRRRAGDGRRDPRHRAGRGRPDVSCATCSSASARRLLERRGHRPDHRAIVVISHSKENGLTIGLIIFLALMFNHIIACITRRGDPVHHEAAGLRPGAVGDDLRDDVHRLLRILRDAGAGDISPSAAVALSPAKSPRLSIRGLRAIVDD